MSFLFRSDCKVPQHYRENRALGKWVAKQREQYKLLQKGKHSFLTPLRIEKLNEAGFVWSIRSSLEPGGDEIPPSVEKEAAKVDAAAEEGKKKEAATDTAMV